MKQATISVFSLDLLNRKKSWNLTANGNVFNTLGKELVTIYGLAMWILSNFLTQLTLHALSMALYFKINLRKGKRFLSFFYFIILHLLFGPRIRVREKERERDISEKKKTPWTGPGNKNIVSFVFNQRKLTLHFLRIHIGNIKLPPIVSTIYRRKTRLI
jgi:hypothetical protein